MALTLDDDWVYTEYSRIVIAIHQAQAAIGEHYHSGADIQPEELQHLLMKTASFPITSQPSAGVFAEMYKRLAAHTGPTMVGVAYAPLAIFDDVP